MTRKRRTLGPALSTIKNRTNVKCCKISKKTFSFGMSKLDEGYKCSACVETFLSSKSAKIHVAKSKGCKSSAKRKGILLKILQYQINTGSVDRKVGGCDSEHWHLNHPIE